VWCRSCCTKFFNDLEVGYIDFIGIACAGALNPAFGLQGCVIELLFTVAALLMGNLGLRRNKFLLSVSNRNKKNLESNVHAASKLKGVNQQKPFLVLDSDRVSFLNVADTVSANLQNAHLVFPSNKLVFPSTSIYLALSSAKSSHSSTVGPAFSHTLSALVDAPNDGNTLSEQSSGECDKVSSSALIRHS
jgi:hypothetical protein